MHGELLRIRGEGRRSGGKHRGGGREDYPDGADEPVLHFVPPRFRRPPVAAADRCNQAPWRLGAGGAGPGTKWGLFAHRALMFKTWCAAVAASGPDLERSG